MQANAKLIERESRSWALNLNWPAVAVILFGILFLYGVGFSNISAAHNARHANGFPCH